MSSGAEKPFVSSIPRNTLAPMFIGRPEVNALETSVPAEKKGVYVPACLKNQETTSILGSNTKKSVVKKPLIGSNDEFPSLGGVKKPAVQVQKMNYLEMLKKPKAEADTDTNNTKTNTVPSGFLVLGRNMPMKKWSDEEHEELNYSAPVYYEEAAEEYDEDEEYDE